MPTRNVVVTDAQALMIDELVERGRFQNASEVLRSGLRLLEEREAELEEIRAGLKEGLAQMARGEVIDGKTAVMDAFERARKRHHDRRGDESRSKAPTAVKDKKRRTR